MNRNEKFNEKKYFEFKEQIRKSSEIIIAHLGNLTDTNMKDESLRIIHRDIGVIISNLDYIKSFGDKKEQELIAHFQDIGVRYNAYTDTELFIESRSAIAYWAGKANTIGLNLKEKNIILMPINIDFNVFKLL
jgi:hypothetical protein